MDKYNKIETALKPNTMIKSQNNKRAGIYAVRTRSYRNAYLGYWLVLGVAIFTTIFLWIRNKQQTFGYLWIVIHFLLFSIGVYFIIQAMSFDFTHPMASEEISLKVGIAGVFWSLSMICLVFGVFSFSRLHKSQP